MSCRIYMWRDPIKSQDRLYAVRMDKYVEFQFFIFVPSANCKNCRDNRFCVCEQVNMENVLPTLTVKVLEVLVKMQNIYSSEWAEIKATFQAEWDSLPSSIKPPPGGKKINYKFKSTWADCAHLLLDKNSKKLGYMNVASSYYARVHNETKNVSTAYDDDTIRNYSSEIVFKSRENETSVKEHVKSNLQAFQKSMGGRSQSGRLMYERMKHVQSIVCWEEEFMLTGIKDADGKQVRTWYQDLRVREEWPTDLWNAIISLQKCVNDRTIHRRLIQMYEEWPFLLRMNDDSGQYSPLLVEPQAKYSYVSMKRADGVTKAYFAGNYRFYKLRVYPGGQI